MKNISSLSILLLFATPFNRVFSQLQLKRFDYVKYEYKGGAVDQAGYLLRNNFMGKVDTSKAVVPQGLLDKIGTRVSLEKSQLITFLSDNKIKDEEIGGSINNGISFIIDNGKKKYARYFVMHDVSCPCYNSFFPANIDSNTWSYNNLRAWRDTVNHIYVTRTGQSKTMVDLSKGWRATKFESKILGKKSRGLFIHVELVQPCVYPPGDCKTAPIAPSPAFTKKQYERLALIYLIASFRKGEWLIPVIMLALMKV
jgi:hypothetical protein